MNRRDIVDAFDALQDNPAGFMLWMAGYLAAGNTYTEENDDGWIKHDGGPCPVYPGSMVMVRSRNGAESGSLLAKVVAWRHRNGDWDTVAYKVVTPTAS